MPNSSIPNDGELVPLRTGFDVTLRGYRRGPVRQYVQSVETELRMVAADRDANADLAEDLTRQVEELRAQNADLADRLDRVCREPIPADALQERLRRMLELAQDEAAEITARAQAAAEHCWATAEETAGRLRARYTQLIAELDTRRQEMESEHRLLMRQTRAEVEAMTTESHRCRRELDEQAERRRTKIDLDFTIAMANRRTEAMRRIAEQQAAARAQADRLVREATEEADRRVSAAQLQVDDLQEVRRQVAGQLRGTRETLTEARSLLEPVPGELEPEPGSVPPQRDRSTAEQAVTRT